MSQQESIAPGRSTRIVTAASRLEMAEERARILGRTRTLPSALEVAAARWDRGGEGVAKGAREEKVRFSPAAETHHFSLQQVRLSIRHAYPGDGAGWKSYMPPGQAEPRRGRVGRIAVGSYARRLIQRERAGGGRVVTDPRPRALEEAAQRWEARRKAGSCPSVDPESGK